jgi:hypothetical protein
MSERQAGPILDGLGVTLDLDDDDLLVEVLIVGKVTRLSDGGGTSVLLAKSDGMDWVSQLGLIEAARQVCTGGIEEAE